MLQNTKGEEIVLHKDQAGIIIHLADKKGFTLPYEDVEKLIKLIFFLTKFPPIPLALTKLKKVMIKGCNM